MKLWYTLCVIHSAYQYISPLSFIHYPNYCLSTRYNGKTKISQASNGK